MIASIKYPVSTLNLGELEKRYVIEALESGWISSLGSFIPRFEREFAEYCEVDHALTVSNGTDSLLLALKGVGVGYGDEVVVPGLTFAAVPAAVVQAGATPVIVDVDPAYWGLDPELLERAISPRTRAVIPVHLYGHPADMDSILAVCRPKGIRVIEDCAEAHGAIYRGKKVGGLADVGCFSFYGNKIITTGEGGMVTTNDADLLNRLRFLKDHAMDMENRYHHPEVGYNMRMTNIQAALGLGQLSRIGEFLARRKRILEEYCMALAGATDVEVNPAMGWAEPVNWMVCVLWEGGDAGRRNRLMARLRARGVDSRPFFWPLRKLPPYAGCRVVGGVENQTPVADRLADLGLNLPCHPGLVESDVGSISSIFLEEKHRADMAW